MKAGATLAAAFRTPAAKTTWTLGAVEGRRLQSPGAAEFLAHRNAQIARCARGGQWTLALHLFQELGRHSVLPDVVSWTSVISSCSRARQWRTALRLFAELRLCPELRPNVVLCSAAISAFGAGGLWASATSLLEELHASDMGERPDVAAYSAAISACAKAARWEHTIGLLALMQGLRLAPNTACLTAVAGGLLSCGGRQAKVALEMLADPSSDASGGGDGITARALVQAAEE
ncbi:unnamed protein product, partial [Polarella glacialis]